MTLGNAHTDDQFLSVLPANTAGPFSVRFSDTYGQRRGGYALLLLSLSHRLDPITQRQLGVCADCSSLFIH